MDPVAPASPLDLLAGADLDPQMLAILKLAMGRQQAAPADEETEALRERLNRLERSNRNLLRMMDKLAGALGACRECWGADPGCSSCGGDGHPGFFPPDRLAFEAFVLPAVRAMAARIAPGQRRPPAAVPAWASPFAFHPTVKET